MLHFVSFALQWGYPDVSEALQLIIGLSVCMQLAELSACAAASTETYVYLQAETQAAAPMDEEEDEFAGME